MKIGGSVIEPYGEPLVPGIRNIRLRRNIVTPDAAAGQESEQEYTPNQRRPGDT